MEQKIDLLLEFLAGDLPCDEYKEFAKILFKKLTGKVVAMNRYIVLKGY